VVETLENNTCLLPAQPYVRPLQVRTSDRSNNDSPGRVDSLLQDVGPCLMRLVCVLVTRSLALILVIAFLYIAFSFCNYGELFIPGDSPVDLTSLSLSVSVDVSCTYSFSPLSLSVCLCVSLSLSLPLSLSPFGSSACRTPIPFFPKYL